MWCFARIALAILAKKNAGFAFFAARHRYQNVHITGI